MLAESNSGISSTSNSAFHSLLTGREGLILGDGNQVSLQHNSIEHDKRTVGGSECDPDCSSKAENQPPPENNPSEPDQVTEGCREPGAARFFYTIRECQGARPKPTQTQGPMDPPLWPISSPVSDNTTEPLQSFTGQSHCPWVRNGMSSDGVNTRNCLLLQTCLANRNHSLNGDFSSECDSLLNQNPIAGNVLNGIRVVQSDVPSDGNSTLIADQRSHHSNLSLERQFRDREQAEAPFSANGIILEMLPFIVRWL